jgi:dUTP pyrophosphatase
MAVVQGGRVVIPTGWKMHLPEGVYGRIAPRSGLAVRLGLDVGAGVIDPDYRGEVGVVLFNHGQNTVTIMPGDRIAQLVLEQVRIVPVTEVESVSSSASASERGEGGFGSTGI